MNSLVVVRHAKSDWPPGVADMDRPLADRGRRDAPLIGRWISGNVAGPHRVLVSPAARTRQTWGLMCESLPDADVYIEPALYEAPWTALLRIVREHIGAPGSVVVVGHNPGSQDLVAALAAHSNAGGERRRRVLEKFPTSAVAVLTPGSVANWLTEDGAELRDFEICRG